MSLWAAQGIRAYSDTDTDKADLLKQHTDGVLNANSRPLVQFKGRATCERYDDERTRSLHPLGSFWPGETMKLDINGFPSLTDGLYECRRCKCPAMRRTR